MKKRYICFTCYSFHPEMKGITEEEFEAGDNVCKEEKCKFKGQPLEPANLCETCSELFRENENHEHFKQ
ncbi:hypothetical protein A2690_01940 [Candidatus Roizmanbacteria bacterium RIFCSPHIGHO2_01_FULL_39_12b]|uniref:Uncharacterized protein n=1 Tax=Candidatus Roizmanbacteria bacterium RIFCSPHIGHO2_01_FULL_39_12b TaxID=1802030 RepID=A0A1F7GB92_9BACT|nr:MAG: hypothetical protein A2690_01940 [Candidatus Roizmanbacteria bacterium RIFCSPHIGHO2_01_FULL_39_12b]OGK46183.1 MAG: hypothetical protein A3B46_03185 [Candidatus Roizmanbacteria bacterium RIFCSPLOWO2_01_FULL_39_19]